MPLILCFFVFEILNFENRFYFLSHIITHFQPNTSLLNSSLEAINLYVGNDGKLHFVDSAGADTVIPFSSGVKSIQCRFAITGDSNGHWRALAFYVNNVAVWAVNGNQYAAYPIVGNVFNVTVNLEQFK